MPAETRESYRDDHLGRSLVAHGGVTAGVTGPAVVDCDSAGTARAARAVKLIFIVAIVRRMIFDSMLYT